MPPWNRWEVRPVVNREVAGSTPAGGAQIGTVREPAERPSSNLGDVWVRIPPVPFSLILKKKWVVFLTAACKAVAVKL
jgi:hypothetical protein